VFIELLIETGLELRPQVVYRIREGSERERSRTAVGTHLLFYFSEGQLVIDYLFLKILMQHDSIIISIWINF
jgi:hypothetical protein